MIESYERELALEGIYPDEVVPPSYKVIVCVVEAVAGVVLLFLWTEDIATRSLISSHFLFRDTRFPLFPTPGRSVSSSWVILGRCVNLLKKSVYSCKHYLLRATATQCEQIPRDFQFGQWFSQDILPPSSHLTRWGRFPLLLLTILVPFSQPGAATIVSGCTSNSSAFFHIPFMEVSGIFKSPEWNCSAEIESWLCLINFFETTFTH